MVDISIVNGIINQLLTWGAPSCTPNFHVRGGYPRMPLDNGWRMLAKHVQLIADTVRESPGPW